MATAAAETANIFLIALTSRISRGKNRAKKGCVERLSRDEETRTYSPSAASNRPRMPDQAETGIGASLISCHTTCPSRQRKCGSTLVNGTRRPSEGVFLHTIVLTRRAPQPGHGSTSTNGGAPIGMSSRAVLRARQAAMSWTSPMSSLHGLRCGSGRTKEVRAEGCKINADLLQDFPSESPGVPLEAKTFSDGEADAAASKELVKHPLFVPQSCHRRARNGRLRAGIRRPLVGARPLPHALRARELLRDGGLPPLFRAQELCFPSRAPGLLPVPGGDGSPELGPQMVLRSPRPSPVRGQGLGPVQHQARRTVGPYPVAVLRGAGRAHLRERSRPAGQPAGAVAIPMEQLDRHLSRSRDPDSRGRVLRAPSRGTSLGRLPAYRRHPPHDLHGQFGGAPLGIPALHGGEFRAGQRSARLRYQWRGLPQLPSQVSFRLSQRHALVPVGPDEMAHRGLEFRRAGRGSSEDPEGADRGLAAADEARQGRSAAGEGAGGPRGGDPAAYGGGASRARPGRGSLAHGGREAPRARGPRALGFFGPRPSLEERSRRIEGFSRGCPPRMASRRADALAAARAGLTAPCRDTLEASDLLRRTPSVNP